VDNDNYPVDWPQIARAVKEANLWCCSQCGRQCRRPGESAGAPILTVAHFDHDYEGQEIFVAALCARCHLQHDAPYGAQFRLRRRLKAQRQAGQLLFGFIAAASPALADSGRDY